MGKYEMKASRIYILLTIFIFFAVIVLWIDFNIFPLFKTENANYHKINNIIRTIALSYITSFVFYFIIIYLREQKDKKNSKKFISRKTVGIISSAEHLRSKIEEIDDEPFKDFIPEEELLRKKLNKINLEEDAGERRLYPFSYEQLFKEHTTEIRVVIDRLLILLPYLDTKYVSKLNDIYECSFFNMSTKFAPISMINNKLKELNAPNFSTVYVSPLCDYFKLIEELKNISP